MTVSRNGPTLDERKAIMSRCNWGCEVGTDGCEVRATQIHHTSGRGWDGSNNPEHLIAVCGLGNASGCHGAIHADRPWAERHGLLAKRGETPEIPPRFGCPRDCTIDHRGAS